jgi:butyrate kinase
MQTKFTILIVNPGSTSTKLAIYQDEKFIDGIRINHHVDVLKKFSGIWDQYAFRMDAIKNWVNENLNQCSAVATMGGLIKPVEGGIYRINQKMINDARANYQGEHASNLGCAMADELAKIFKCPSFVVDPVSVDEFEPLAFYSGHPEIKRKPLSHALNLHATARRAAADLKISYEDSSFIIGHLGGGISIAPVRNGKIIDVNDASSDGPFSPERTGGLPLQQFIKICFSGKYSENDMRKFVMGKGGLIAYLGTNSIEEVEKKINAGDSYAKEVYEAMAYQIAKEIGAMSTVLCGRINAIVLTGGIANSKMLTSWIEKRVSFIAPVLIYPGEDEMRSLAEAALRILKGEEQLKEYGDD